MRGRFSVPALAFGAACVASCQNAGQDRVLGIQATGVIKVQVFFDRDGNLALDAADTSLTGIGLRLIASGTQDTVARAVSDTAGRVRFGAVPVGTMIVAVDSSTVPGDSLQVTRIEAPTVAVTPGDSFLVRVAVSYPQVTIAQARTLSVGKRVFVVGVALNNVFAWGDSTVHLGDTSVALLATSVRVLVFTGDSVRVLGTRRTRSGEPTLDTPTIFPLASGATTPTHQLSTALGASANGGALDAALAKVVSATVQDTATVVGNRRLTVTDGSGPLVVQLDTSAGFRGVALAADSVGAKLDVTGVLVPVGAGTWLMRPRAPTDVVAK